MQDLVIGASRGIGFELVQQYRADGAQVSATARDESALTATDNGGFFNFDGAPLAW